MWSEGWGGLFKDEQYRFNKERFASVYKVLRSFEQPPAAARLPSLPGGAHLF